MKRFRFSIVLSAGILLADSVRSSPMETSPGRSRAAGNMRSVSEPDNRRARRAVHRLSEPGSRAGSSKRSAVVQPYSTGRHVGSHNDGSIVRLQVVHVHASRGNARFDLEEAWLDLIVVEPHPSGRKP